MAYQKKLTEKQDEFVKSLHMTPEKISEDLKKARGIKGFPIGDLEDILELSDPPYYTAYPNPYIKDFIDLYSTPYDEENDDYDKKPYFGDISEGKNDPVYNIHYYHTKVPPTAIIPLIKHYTNKNDIILDSFCGSGMTGVAARDIKRRTILIDLGSAPSYITSNFNLRCDKTELKNIFDKILNEVKSEYGWMFKTVVDGEEKNIKYSVWSQIVICPNCKTEHVLYDICVVDNKTQKNAICPSCSFEGDKKKFEKKIIDGNVIHSIVKIIYWDRKNIEKTPSSDDYDVLNQIDNLNIPFWYPNQLMMFKGAEWGDSWRKGYHRGINNVSQFYTKKNLIILSCFFDKINNVKDKKIRNHLYFIVTAGLPRLSKLTRYMPEYGHRHVGPLSGTLYLPYFFEENNAIDFVEKKYKKYYKNIENFQNKSIVSNQSATDLTNIPENTIDYVFIDPPFGDNLMYSELNFLLESWLKVFTNNSEEAIINKSQNKDLFEYSLLIKESFTELYRVLKPNRWMSVEFHNSRADVWKSIQNSLSKAGFVVGQVAVLDKKKGTTKQLTYSGTVKNDLIISAYKPDKKFTKSFLQRSGLDMEFEFVQMHLKKLPIEPNIERTQQMIYSRMLAQYVQNEFEVRMDAVEFYLMLKKHFIERDGYWFISDQIVKYEKKMKYIKNQLDPNQTVLGIYDEKSIIHWLLSFLESPKSYSEIYTSFTQNLLISEDKMPELKTILEENFSTEDGKYRLPTSIERKEKEEIREKRLMKEFDKIFTEAQSKRKIKEVRKEALLHGLMTFYQNKDVEKIRIIGKRLDQNIISSDDDISAIIDWAMYN